MSVEGVGNLRRPPRLARSTALNFADTAISLFSAILVTVVAARILGPEEYGVYSLVITILWFTYALAGFGINETVRRYVAELDGRGLRTLAAVVAGHGLRNGVLSVAIASLALAAAAAPLAGLFHHPQLQRYLLVGTVGLVPRMVASVLRNVLRGLQQYHYFVRMNLVTSPLWVCACTLAVWFGGGVIGLLVVGIGIGLLNLVIVGVWARREVGSPRWHERLPQELRSRLTRYNRAVALLLILNMVVWQRSELLFLGRFNGADQVAYYAVPFSLTERLTELLPGALLGVLLPGLTYLQTAGDPERFAAMLSHSLRWLAMLALPGCLFGIPLSAAVVSLLYGPAYSGAIPVMQILLLATLFGVLGQASASALLGMEEQSWLLKTGVAAALLSLLLDLLLIPRWGAVGAAAANTTTQAAWALATFAPLWRRVLRSVRLDVLKCALSAVPITFVLTGLLVVRPPIGVLIAAGAVALGLYAAALHRMHLIPVETVLSSILSHAQPDEVSECEY